jgi:hypothetical protein
MKANEIIIESVSFGVAVLKDAGNGEKYYSGEDFGQMKMVPCVPCDGTGDDEYRTNTPCRYCHGTGKMEEFVSDAPALQVSNHNAGAILDMLGIPYDYAGVIPHNRLPQLMRKLIHLKNTAYSSEPTSGEMTDSEIKAALKAKLQQALGKNPLPYTEPASTSQGKMQTSIDPDTGLSKIGRGATIHNAGRSNEQVMRYIDSLINLIHFAQENNASVSWG